ncbi:hypothetical protein C6Y14_12230 [Streptomyces dioscori]|uniref:DUF3806 domain-containing protein n=1 Tax=Streptomyces dioscori TaxID=2109333 RepID=A0A2P8Q9L9_9ACTN|nr:hypothetical protein [Streptomyces dioscori]PSM42947.1 hypothetical protein C6Y14_12230 [Streptomyces dioscori]
MHVHLNPPLEPSDAPQHAAAIVATAADISGADLDFSPESILLVEDILDGFRAEGVTSESMTESLIAFGCYIGEILTRHTGGVWRCDSTAHAESVSLVVELPDARRCRPIDWVFSRLARGAGVNIRALYAAASTANDPADGKTC